VPRRRFASGPHRAPSRRESVVEPTASDRAPAALVAGARHPGCSSFHALRLLRPSHAGGEAELGATCRSTSSVGQTMSDRQRLQLDLGIRCSKSMLKSPQTEPAGCRFESLKAHHHRRPAIYTGSVACRMSGARARVGPRAQGASSSSNLSRHRATSPRGSRPPMWTSWVIDARAWPSWSASDRAVSPCSWSGGDSASGRRATSSRCTEGRSVRSR